MPIYTPSAISIAPRDATIAPPPDGITVLSGHMGRKAAEKTALDALSPISLTNTAHIPSKTAAMLSKTITGTRFTVLSPTIINSEK